MKRKISVVTGSRADYGILRPVLNAIQASKKLELYLIVAGMHLSKKHGMTINEIKKDGFKIYAQVDMYPRGDSPYFMAKALGKGIVSFSEILMKLKPDINLILGDRDEAFASALVAYHMNIINAHIHGGDKSKAGIDEYTRHAITKISNIHFAATKKSKERIIKMGENPKFVFLTGSPSIDEVVNNKITPKKILEKRYGIQFNGNEILLLQHPVTTQIEDSEKHILNILRAVARLKKITIAIAPNSDSGSQAIFKNLKLYAIRYPFIKLYTNIPRSDYLGMLKNCGVLIGNSSSGMIEASYFNIPVVNIGIRQKDRERGKNVIDVENVTMNSIYTVIKHALKTEEKKKLSRVSIYGDGAASEKIVRILEKIDFTDKLIQKQIMY
jgi:UDP-N-acetylglucosamine 2-epimerase (non-hydrolysing)/GDP/UDP-N,N'-diacetylbacillosamine 2-epimerase (hydrolysing)